MSWAISSGTPTRARGTGRGTEIDLLRRLRVDDYPLDMTETLYERHLIRFSSL